MKLREPKLPEDHVHRIGSILQKPRAGVLTTVKDTFHTLALLRAPSLIESRIIYVF